MDLDDDGLDKLPYNSLYNAAVLGEEGAGMSHEGGEYEVLSDLVE